MPEEGIGQNNVSTLESMAFPESTELTYVRSGKVREVFETPAHYLAIVTTDRVSAFDTNLGVIPGKGQVLNELSAWWFEKMRDIVPNHVVSVPDPNVTIAKRLTPVPVEVIVRGVITGVTGTSLWVNYEKAVPNPDGSREVYGIQFPPGLKKNDVLPQAVITPTTKAEAGAHDERLTEKEIVKRGIVNPATWETVRSAALAMFARAQEISRTRGFVLVDTKIEFGTDSDGRVHVMDELFTGDSSRFWLASTLNERLESGYEPDNYDKEYLRIMYKAMGYDGGETTPKEVPLAIQQEMLRRYVALYEGLTGKPFELPHGDVPLRIRAHMGEYISHELAKSLEKERRMAQVVILMGSEKDKDHAQKIVKTLQDFGIASELRIGSAHKTPEHVLSMIKAYDADETRQTVYIAVAGRSNALGGFIDAATKNPVISCPPKGTEWFDLFSSLRMPSGVASSVVIEPESAALLAAKIFAGTRPNLAKQIMSYQAHMKEATISADDAIIHSTAE